MTVGGKRQGEGQASDSNRGQHPPGTGIDHGDTEVSLVYGVEDAALGVEGQIAGVAVEVAVAIEIDRSAAVGVPIQQADSAGIPLGNEHRMLVGERQTHENAAPVRGLLFGRFARSCPDMADVPFPGPVAFQDGQRVGLRAAVGRDNGAAGSADCQPERAIACREFVTEGGDHPAAGQDGRPRAV